LPLLEHMIRPVSAGLHVLESGLVDDHQLHMKKKKRERERYQR
jgi:hypothetical protein